MAKADLKHYEDAQGRVFSLNESDARLLGYTPVKIADKRVTGPAQGQGREAAATLAAREKALADGEAKLAADREAFEKAQAASKTAGGQKG